jgi:zinc protease
MAAELLTKGAGKRSAEEIAAAIEGVGGSLSASASNDFLTVSAAGLAPSAPLAFELVGEAVARPTFPEKEIELLRTQTLSALQLELAQPASLAARFFRQGLYGEHPYGRSPSPETVRGITRADLVAFHGARVRPRGALLVVAGDIALDRAKALAEQAFAGWAGLPAAAPAVTPPPTRAATQILLVHRPGSVQSNILVGNLTTGPTDPSRYAATVANQILGGGADARLFDVLREKKGWTYGAYSSFSRPRGTGHFQASAEVRTEVTDSALVELLAQLRRIGRETVAPAELEAAKGRLVGSFPLTVETAADIAGAVSRARLFGLPADYLQMYRTRLAAVTTPQLQQAARALIRPEQALVVVVGDAQKLHDRLKAIAPVRLVSTTGDPMAAADLAPRAAAASVNFGALAARRDSFVVLVQGNPMGAATASLAKAADGWTITSQMSIGGGMVQQSGSVTTDARLSPRRVQGGGSIQGQALKTDVTVAGGRATGTASVPGAQGIQTVSVDAAVPPDAVDDNAVQFLVGLLEWRAGARHTVNAFSASRNAVRPITLAVTGTERVTVPAGTFEAYRVEQTGGEAPLTLYVTAAAPHRLVRVTFAGQPLELVLAK